MLKYQIYFLLSFQIFPSKSQILNNNQDSARSVAKTIIDVIREFYIKNDLRFDLIIYDETTNHINDVISEVTKEISQETPTKIKLIKEFSLWNHKFTQSAIILMKSKNSLISLHENTKTNRTRRIILNSIPRRLKFLIYVEEIQNVYKLWDTLAYHSEIDYRKTSDLRHYEFFIINEESFVILYAYLLYSEIKCVKFRLQPLNFFDKTSQTWIDNLENFNHLTNLHDCVLNFIGYIHYNPSWYLELNMKNPDIRLGFRNSKVHGLTHEILQLSSKRNNFSLTYGKEEKNEIFKHQIDFKNGEYRALKNDHHLWSEPYGSTEYYYLVTENDLYTNYEKLFMPFDETTWILLSVTILLTFLIIFGTNYCPQWIRTLIHGTGYNIPGYNVLGIIFGIPQLNLPNESVNRFAFLLFIWFWLIFRTCYQSMLFEFMTSNMRKPLPASVDDLREMNYTIIVSNNAFKYSFMNFELLNGRESINNLTFDILEYRLLYNKSLNGKSQGKYAFFVNNFLHAVLNSTFHKTLPIMENEKITKMVSYTIEGNDMFMVEINEIIHWLIPSGIPQYLDNYGLWFLKRPFDVEIKDSRRILSMTDLEFGFVLWLASLSLPITCFFIEILSVKFKKFKEVLRRTLIFLISKIFEITLKRFMERYHDRCFCSESLSVTKAMIDVIREFYIGNNLRFDFIIYGKLTSHMNEVITEVIKEISQDFFVNIQQFVNGNYKIKLEQSAVIFTESIENLHEFHKNTYHLEKAKNSLRFTDKHFKFLIYIEQFEEFNLKVDQIISPPMWFYEFYLVNIFKFVTLYALDLYSEDSCGKLSPKVLNFYSKDSQKWNKKLEKFDHFRNFHGCILSTVVDFGPNWYLNVNKSENKKYFQAIEVFKTEIAHGNFKYSGLIHEIMETVAKKANFTLHYTIKNYNGELVSGVKNFQSEFKFSIHISFNSFEKNFENSKIFWYSEPCGSVDFYFLVMPNDLYTNYEKLLMPFDRTTWILMILTIALTFGIILGYYVLPKCIKMIFYGKDMKNPAFNTLGVIFGISQLKLPQRSINRFALSLFIWFCLIFRTCYQSMLFEFMTSDMRKPLPASIDDLREMNYTVMILDLPTKHFHRMYRKILDNRQSPNYLLEEKNLFMEYYGKALNKTLIVKHAFFVSNYLHAAMNESTKNSLTIMNNEGITDVFGFTLPGDNILKVHLNEIISQLIPSGIIQHLNEFGIWYFFRRLFIEEEDSRRILSMTDLEFGFVLWLASLSLPITCFIIEILNGNFENLKKKAEALKFYTIGKTIEIVLEKMMEKYQNRL
ncbi:hypothetical protein PVAND_017350 [Polypedilum vanderplanki]|uniref:Ionotropic receptor n=1 Tax=Polypedilum vanderplanki TaxID=319348 RepID=A0A9J6BIS4_POLVA|nr:hypothetical protein PVAND_017350 [Polypedilum vanderplanki]